MTQNVYDDPDFFEGYSQLQRSVHGLDGAPEWPAVRAMLPDMAGARVLDLGCGFGWFARWAAEHGARSVIGYDVSANMLERARSDTPPDLPVEYRTADLDRLTLTPESCDVAHSSLALHYVVDLQRLVREIAGALVPGGTFTFTAEHPIRTAPLHPEFVTDDRGALRWQIDHYLVEGPRTVNWIDADVVKQHRTVGSHLRTLIDHGFVITGVEEFCPSDEQLRQHPEWERELHRPSFMIVSATRA